MEEGDGVEASVSAEERCALALSSLARLEAGRKLLDSAILDLSCSVGLYEWQQLESARLIMDREISWLRSVYKDG